MIKVFVDTDVILDLLAERQPHFHYSALFFTLVERLRIKLFSSPTVFINAFYILRKQLGIETAKGALRRLRTLINIVESSAKDVDAALNSVMSDFEDAVQYYTVVSNKINFIVTRNVKDYKLKDVDIVTPQQFVEMMQ